MDIIIYIANLNDIIEKQKYHTEVIQKDEYSNLNNLKKYIDNKYNLKTDIIISDDKIISELEDSIEQILFIETQKTKVVTAPNTDNIFNNLINNILQNVNLNNSESSSEQQHSNSNYYDNYNLQDIDNNQHIYSMNNVINNQEFEFAEELLKLNNIGFNNNYLNQEALTVTNGNIDLAINYILEND